MSDKRKLLCEMDKTFKRIQEGLEVFDETWLSLLEADTYKVREKYEEEVNNQIKKLQRLRDQVRGWIAGGEVKDKEPLNKARRDVETRMERLRDYERESKTKEYSRAGLALEKVDPEQKCRDDARQWLSDCIGQLNCGIEQFDSELEVLDGGVNRKKLERDKQDKLTFLEKGIVSHRGHLAKFEAMLRMLDNESLSPTTIFSLKDEFDFYMDQVADGQIREVDHDTMYYGIEFENERGDVRANGNDQFVNGTNGHSDARPDSRDAVVPDNALAAATVPSSGTAVAKAVNGGPSKLLNGTVPATSFAANAMKKFSTIIPALQLQQQDLHLPKARSQAPATNGTGKVIRRSTSKRTTVVKESSRSPTTKAPSNNVGSLSPSHAGATVPMQTTKRKSFAELVAIPPSPKASKQPSPVSKTASVSTPLLVRRAVIVSSNVNNAPNGVSNAPSTVITASSAARLPAGQINRKPWNAWEDAEVKEGESTVRNVKVETPPLAQTNHTTVSNVVLAIQSGTSENISADVVSEADAYAKNVKAESAGTAIEVDVERGDGDAKEDRTQSPDDFRMTSSTTLSSRLFADLSVMEPNSTEMIWKTPAPVLDWPSSSSSVSDSHSNISFISPRSSVMTELSVTDWQPLSTFGVVSSADEFFGSSYAKISPLPPRRATGTAAFECEVHWRLSTEVLFYVFYFQGDKLARIHAAKDLELRNWSFYTRLSVWMQRREFPRLQTAEYERGDFRYWDKDSWKEEKLSDFLVDYRYVKNPSEELMKAL